MTTGRKLIAAALIIASVTTYLAVAGATASWQYYLTVDECLEVAPQIVGSPLRVHGRVRAASLTTASQTNAQEPPQTRFVLEGARGSLEVLCSGAVPDNLAEGMDVVVEGELERQDLMRGHKVMTKCASKYASQGNS